jgi:5-methylcytosine-specific restriction enzyme subunit McrC
VAGTAIPIENIYYLLCYAWNRLEEAALTDVTPTPEMRLPDLFARVLRGGVAHLLKRGLDRAYVTAEEEIAGVRGRLDVAMSVKRATFPRARAWCAFDELSPDTPPNRIVRTTLRTLASVAELDTTLAEELRDLYRRIPGVQEIRITGQTFRRFTLGSNNRYYGFLLDICELVHRNLLVDERSGAVKFRDFTRDNAQMGRLFERFLFRFYDREQAAFRVEAPHLEWNATGNAEALEHLPRMRTDIVLKSPERLIVMDAKYYGETLSEHLGKATVRSDHLYQLFAYLRHLTGASEEVVGILVYPRTTESVSINVTLFEHPVRVATINLAQAWPAVHRDLLALIERRREPDSCRRSAGDSRDRAGL